MKNRVMHHLLAIRAITEKDLRELWLLVLLSWAVFLIQPALATLTFEGDLELWQLLQTNFYWVGYFLGALLMVSVLQLDPAASLNHDWLTRPISRMDWLLAKLLFLVVTVCIPVVVSRILVNLGSDLGIGLSVSYALGLEKPGSVYPVPLLFTAALLAPTLRKLIVLLVIVLFVFLSPAWSLTSPLFGMLGIELGREFEGMMWLHVLPVFIAGVAGTLLVYWLFYSRREQRHAVFAFWATVAVIFLAMYPPVSLFSRYDAIALHKAMFNGNDDMPDDAVLLDHALACFASAAGGNFSNQDSENSVLTQANWVDGARRMSEAGAITFATRVNARKLPVTWFQLSPESQEIPVGWRMDPVSVRARFSADSLDESDVLLHSSSALNYRSPMSSTITDYWLIPADSAEKLSRDPSTRLTLEFDLALLSPSIHELKTDGQRHDLGQLGSCKADVDHNAGTIDVDCLKRGVQPELMSAQLPGLDSSRVDNVFQPNFTPDWLEAFGRTHVELTLRYPDLVDSSSIILTAYNVERIISKQLESTGVLGDSVDICPLPGSETYESLERSNWSDRSPHETSSVAVERGVRVEVLDWRGGEIKNAPTLFLLPGGGATAHSYDEVAPKLAEKYNVVGMTRRGGGDSGKPDHGYDTARLSQDVIAVLDTLGIEKPVLAGMSIAGEELSYLGANYPERFSGLVYLDAAYDHSLTSPKGYRDLILSLPPDPPVRPSESVSYEALEAYAQRRGRPRNIPEGEIMASYDLATGQVKHDSLYMDAVKAGLQKTDYRNITVPALGIFALPGSPEFMMEPWYDRDDPVVRETVEELYQFDRRGKERQIERFDTEVPDSEVLILEDGYHWVFLAHEQEIIEAIDGFIERFNDQ